MNTDAWVKLWIMCDAVDLRLEDRGNGHWQVLGGKLLVNYYPARRTLYVAGTNGGRRGATFEQVVKAATNPPPSVPRQNRDKRKDHTRSLRGQMLKKDNRCHWCKQPMTLDDSSIDHVIPLARGGLENANNRVLAHPDCNHERGSEMPELKS